MSDDRWQDAFFKRRPGTGAAPLAEDDAAPEPEESDDRPGVDPALYRAFIVARGRSRPTMFLDLRSFEPRSGTLQGTMLSYPQLLAVDYVGDHTILLDFGMRHVRIEGVHLAELVTRLHSASVSVIQAWSPKVWGPAEPPPGQPVVRSIVHLGLGN